MAQSTIRFDVRLRWWVSPLIWAAYCYAFVIIKSGKDISPVEDMVSRWIADYGVRIKAI